MLIINNFRVALLSHPFLFAVMYVRNLAEIRECLEAVGDYGNLRVVCVFIEFRYDRMSLNSLISHLFVSELRPLFDWS